MSVRSFVDSNIWLYAFMDQGEHKREQALKYYQIPVSLLARKLLMKSAQTLFAKRIIPKLKYNKPLVTLKIDMKLFQLI